MAYSSTEATPQGITVNQTDMYLKYIRDHSISLGNIFAVRARKFLNINLKRTFHNILTRDHWTPGVLNPACGLLRSLCVFGSVCPSVNNIAQTVFT